MKLNLSSRVKIITYVLIGALTLFGGELNAAEGYADPQGYNVYKIKGEYPEPGYENTKDTNSVFIGNFRYNHEEMRMLSLEGGGVNGIYSALALAVLEEVMNHPLNAAVKKLLLSKIAEANPVDFANRREKYSHAGSPPLYIRDFFDCAAGASTGSLTAAGLFSKRNYSAIDIARIYGHYGFKIFEQHEQGQSMAESKYSNKGFKELLEIYFGEDTITHDIYDPLAIVARNERDHSSLVLSSLYDCGPHTSISLLNIILSSSSAPHYFPPHNFSFNGIEIRLSEGGAWQNNPSMEAHLHYMTYMGYAEGAIYSFGTGTVPINKSFASEARVVLSGDDFMVVGYPYLEPTVAHTPRQLLISPIKGVYDECIFSTQNSTGSMKFFVQLNPQLEERKGEIDDTSSEFIRYAVQKAFDMTKSYSFKLICAKLFLHVPDEAGLRKIYNDILNKMDQLGSDDYAQINRFEKEHLLKKVLELDFDFFERVMLGFRDLSKVEKFITDLVADLMAVYAAKAEKKSYWDQTYDYFVGDRASEAKEYLQRGMAFHSLAIDTTKLAPISLNELEALKGFTNVGYTYNSYNYNEKPDEDPRVVFLKSLFEKFKTCADDPAHEKFAHSDGYKAWSKKKILSNLGGEIKGVYGTHDSPFMDFICTLFWKYALRNIDQVVTKEQLVDLKNSLHYVEWAEIHKHSVTGTPLAYLRCSTRVTPLITALEKCIDKKFPIEK